MDLITFEIWFDSALFSSTRSIGVVKRVSNKQEFTNSQSLFKLAKFSFVQEEGTLTNSEMANLIARRHSVSLLVVYAITPMILFIYRI